MVPRSPPSASRSRRRNLPPLAGVRGSGSEASRAQDDLHPRRALRHPGMLALHAVSGVLIALAYLLIAGGDLDLPPPPPRPRPQRPAGRRPLHGLHPRRGALPHRQRRRRSGCRPTPCRACSRRSPRSRRWRPPWSSGARSPGSSRCPRPATSPAPTSRSSSPTPRSRPPSPGAPTSSSAPSSASSRRCRARTSPSTPRTPTCASPGSTTPASACTAEEMIGRRSEDFLREGASDESLPLKRRALATGLTTSATVAVRDAERGHALSRHDGQPDRRPGGRDRRRALHRGRRDREAALRGAPRLHGGPARHRLAPLRAGAGELGHHRLRAGPRPALHLHVQPPARHASRRTSSAGPTPRSSPSTSCARSCRPSSGCSPRAAARPSRSRSRSAASCASSS